MISVVLFTRPQQGRVHFIRVMRARSKDNKKRFDFPGGPQVEGLPTRELATKYITEQTGMTIQSASLYDMPLKCGFLEETIFVGELKVEDLGVLREPENIVSAELMACEAICNPSQYAEGFLTILAAAVETRNGTLRQLR